MFVTSKKILAIDSGIGGLSVISELLIDLNAAHSVIYFADLINLPYGRKSDDRIKELTFDNLSWLVERYFRENRYHFDCV